MKEKDDISGQLNELAEMLNNHLSNIGYECHIVEQDSKNGCPPSGYPAPYRKKNAWIVWVLDSQGRIFDLEVYDRDPFNEDQWQRITNYVDRNVKHYFDTGNCESKWDAVTLENLLIKFFVQYDFVDYKTKILTLRRLGRIDEFENQVSAYLDYLGETMEFSNQQ